MKKSLTKLLSSTIAFTLVLAVSGSVGTAQMSKVQAEEVQPERAVAVVEEIKEEPKGAGVIEMLEEKMEAEIPVVEVAKAEAPAAPEVASPVVELADLAKAAEAEEVAPEIEVVPAEEVAAPEVAEEAVAEWDISETASDNVTMKFYADAKEAADGQVYVDTMTGEVIINGTGAMEESIYRHFMSTERYLEAVKAMLEAEYGVEVDLVYDDTITDVLELDANIRFYVSGSDEELFVTEDMCWNLNPSDFLVFSPTEIVISEGITNVSDHAFLCCADLISVELPSTVEYIGQQAFQYCTNLESVEMPENTEIRDNAFGYCQCLTSVQFKNYALDNNGLSANAESVNALTQEEINVLTGVAYR